MSQETVLVTGIAGFVGRHLARLLSRSGNSIFGTILPGEAVPSREELPADLLECRLESPEDVGRVVDQVRPSVVYHLAAQSNVPRSLADPVGTFASNVTGTLNLLEALRDRRELRAVLLISSAEVYGIVPESALPLTEESPLDPANPYACTKVCAEMLGRQYRKSFDLPVVLLRPFNHIGPGQSDAFVASSFARQVAEIEAGIIPPLMKVGNLEARRDFTDVRDVVRAYTLAADRCSPGEAYNICSGADVAIREILDRLLSMASVEVNVANDPERMRPSDLPVLLGDCSKFRSATGWSREIALEETLSDLLTYWRERNPNQSRT